MRDLIYQCVSPQLTMSVNYLPHERSISMYKVLQCKTNFSQTYFE